MLQAALRPGLVARRCAFCRGGFFQLLQVEAACAGFGAGLLAERGWGRRIGVVKVDAERRCALAPVGLQLRGGLEHGARQGVQVHGRKAWLDSLELWPSRSCSGVAGHALSAAAVEEPDGYLRGCRQFLLRSCFWNCIGGQNQNGRAIGGGDTAPERAGYAHMRENNAPERSEARASSRAPTKKRVCGHAACRCTPASL